MREAAKFVTAKECGGTRSDRYLCSCRQACRLRLSVLCRHRSSACANRDRDTLRLLWTATGQHVVDPNLLAWLNRSDIAGKGGNACEHAPVDGNNLVAGIEASLGGRRTGTHAVDTQQLERHAAVGNLLRPADLHTKRATAARKLRSLLCRHQLITHLVFRSSWNWQALQT